MASSSFLRTRGALLLAFLLGSCSRSAPSLDPPVEIDLSICDPEVATLLRPLIEDAKRDVRAAEPRGRLGMAYEANGFFESAAASYEQATRLDPDAARWWYHGAMILYQRGESDRAVAWLDSTIARESAYVPAHRRRGDWLFMRDDLVAAETSFRRVTELAPDHLAGWIGLAGVRLRAHEEEGAEAVLLETIARHPRSPFVPHLRQLLGIVYLRMDRPEEARLQLAQGNLVPPQWPDEWYDEINRYRVPLNTKRQEAETLLATNRTEEAVEILEELRSMHPTNRSFLRQLGAGYLDLGRLDEAQEVLGMCVAHHPADAVAHHRLGQALERLGQREEAMSSFERAVRYEPSLDHLLAAGALAGKLRRFDEASAFLDSAVELEPTNPAVLSARETLERRRRR